MTGAILFRPFLGNRDFEYYFSCHFSSICPAGLSVIGCDRRTVMLFCNGFGVGNSLLFALSSSNRTVA